MVGRPNGIINNSGGSLAPRRNNGNIDWDQVRRLYILPIILAQIAPNTLRGIMYILKSKDILKKSDYAGLITHCRDWRKDGLIQWTDIIDGSGRGVINEFGDFEHVDEYVDTYTHHLQNLGYHFRNNLQNKWRWHRQPNYVEIWCEKHAIAGTVSRLVEDRYVRVAFNKGNPGWGYMHDNCERLKKEMRLLRGRKIHIFYLGDWDKHGRHMDIELKRQLQHFSLWDYVHFERIGLLLEQIDQYGIPENFDGDGYEVDALNAFNPEEFRDLILGKIDPLFDQSIHDEVLARYSEEYINLAVRGGVKFLDED